MEKQRHKIRSSKHWECRESREPLVIATPVKPCCTCCVTGIRDQQKRNLLQRAEAFAADSTSAAELEAARLGNPACTTCMLPSMQHRLCSDFGFCTEVLSPPVCQKRQHQLPGPSGTDDVREDPYYWLRDDDRKDEDVMAHLRVRE